MSKLARYTRFVSLGKRFIWALIFAMIAAVVWIASNNTGEEGARMVFSNMPQNLPAQNLMANPRYQGVDAKNQPYTIIADSALQKDKDTVTLQNVRAEMQQNNGTWLALNAGSGEINLTEKKMELTGGVTVFYDGGYEFRSELAHVDMDKGRAYGETPVEGQAPGGTITAKGFEVIDRGAVIRFNGSVRMKLYTRK